MVLGAAFAGPGAWAQTFRTRDEGIAAGRFLIYPSIRFEFTQNSNISYVSDDLPRSEIVGSGVYVVRPRILVDLPIGETRIRWIYSPQYRGYTTNRITQPDPLSHFFDLEVTSPIGPSLEVVVRDHLVRGTIELREVDAGGELVYGLVPFITHDPSLELDFEFNPRHGVSLIPRYSSVRFDQPGEAAFFSYSTRGLEGRYNYRLTEASVLYGYYGYDGTDQRRDQLLIDDVTVTSRSFGVGLRRTINDLVVTEFAGAYEKMQFAGGLGRDYVGPVLTANAEVELNELAVLNVSVGRRAYQSFFANNSYYLSTEASVRLIQQLGRSIFWQISARYEENTYPDRLKILPGFDSLRPSEGVRRRDKSFEADVGAGFKLRQALRLFIGYNFDRRGSNIVQDANPGGMIDPFKYQVNRIIFRVEAGWL